MYRAKLVSIRPCAYDRWETFASSVRLEPWDDFAYFDLDIGLEGHEGTNSFSVLVATPAAVTRAKGDNKHYRILVVDWFEPEAIAAALNEHVSSIVAHTWDEILRQLQRTMYYEYEKRR